MEWLRIVRVLMWKHCIVRKRKFLSIHAQELFPLLMFVLIFFIRNQLQFPPPPGSPGGNSTLRYQSRTLQLPKPYSLAKKYSPIKLFYWPDNNVTEQLMVKVGTKLKLRKLTSPPTGKTKGYYGVKHKDDLEKYSKNLTENDAVVLFENMEGNTLPNVLVYTIRIRENYQTHVYQAADPTPHQYFGDIYDTFLRVQWAVDTGFIETASNTTVPQELIFQDMPFYDEKVKDQKIQALAAGMVVVVFPCFVFYMSVVRAVSDRAGGIMELVKLSGATSSMLATAHFLNLLPCVGITSIVGGVLLSCTSQPLLEGLPTYHYVIMLLLVGTSAALLGYLLCYALSDPTITSNVAGVLVFVLMLAGMYSATSDTNAGLVLGVMPTVPAFWFFGNLWDIRSKTDITKSYHVGGASILACDLVLVAQSVVFVVLGWYFDKVIPGKFGVALPWNFIFTSEYWCPSRVKPQKLLATDSDTTTDNLDKQYFEPLPDRVELGIRIINVSKTFYSKLRQPVHQALRNVSLDVPRGEVTVLLGHNGAGKSTLMNIITGMFSATEGDVYINGYHSVREKHKIIRHLGYCPQHNMFIEHLNVLEHVIFFTMLKGESYSQARRCSLELLENVSLADKASSMPQQLSGGMMRRLQLCGALAGGSNVLILDEPTSGLDVETRRNLADFILTLRGSRTVLISTHFLEEADALGDRVAALSAARLTCHATPMYLKRAIGSGYRLTLVTYGEPNESDITTLITSHVATATVKDRAFNSITYNLPAGESGKLSGMFEEIENNKERLKIDSIGMGVSTLEDVFFSVCSDVSFTDEVDSATTEPRLKKYKGLNLHTSQFCALFQRQYLYLWSIKYFFLLMYIVVPTVVICVYIYMTNNEAQSRAMKPNPSVELSLDLYKDAVKGAKALYTLQPDQITNFRRQFDDYPFVKFQGSDDIVQEVATELKSDPKKYATYLVGVEVNSTSAKVLFSTCVRHAAPVALNLLSNILAAQHIPTRRGDGKAISVINYPLQGSETAPNKQMKYPKALLSIDSIMNMIVTIISICSGFVMALPVKEKLAGTRQIYLMQGVTPCLYWGTAFVFNFCVFSVYAVLLTTLPMALLDYDNTINEPRFLATVAVLLVFLALSSFPLMYLMACVVEPTSANAFLYGVLMIILIGPTFAAMVSEGAGDTLRYLLYWAPWQQLQTGMTRAGILAYTNAMCQLNRASCPTFHMPDGTPCCEIEDNPKSYWTMDSSSPLVPLLVMAGMTVVFWILLIAYQNGYVSRFLEFVMNANYRSSPPAPQYNDANVEAEKHYVKTAVEAANSGNMPDTLLAYDLHKNYRSCFKSCNAVKGISFSVKKGECFGLLGVNGAGKSTTFQLMTGGAASSRGQLWAAGSRGPCRADRQRRKYIKCLSYCPQAAGVDDFLSARDNIRLVLTLRGLQHADVAALADTWIRAVALEKYASRAVSGYSGGCARRAAAAAALAPRASLALLDEPSAGVDPAARRRLWTALRAHKHTKIITSHSMEEIEALCDRLGIMCGGEMAAHGSPAAIRAAHATGHALRLKLAPDTSAEDHERVKSEIQSRFNCTLKDEHRTMLYFHVNVTMRNSEAFSALESLKGSLPAIEDYSFSATTLEEVFISFAKLQAEKQAQANGQRNGAAIV